jgi:hypothetical protein
MRKFDVATLMQFIKNLITLSYIKCVLNIILLFFMGQLLRITSQGFALGWPNELGGSHLARLIV